MDAQSTRDRVLALVGELDASSVPATLHALTDRLGLSPSTIRFHLRNLVDEGVIEGLPLEVDAPGRRPLRYRRSATAPVAGEANNYRLLSQVLSTVVLDQVHDAAHVCEEAGRVWGEYVARRPRPDARPDDDAAVAELGLRLAELGFNPVRHGEDEIRLRNCPFRAVAEASREVACRVHLGMMRGILEAGSGRVGVEELIPFADPGYCSVRLSLPSAG